MDIPFYLNYLRINYVWPPIPVTCILWWFSATGISNLTNILMAWASVEQYILVFHDRWLLNRKKCLLIHDFPLFGIVLYGFIFYITIFKIFSCDNMYTYEWDRCLYPCFYQNGLLGLYDTVSNSILPTPIITICSIGLVIRVIEQRQTLHRHVEWRKYRKMIIQMLSITETFLIFNLPVTCLVLAHFCGLPNGSAGQFEFYAYYLCHFISLLTPFVCVSSMHKVRKRIKQLIMFRTVNNTITPGQISFP
ncbi:unnamed protein product [Rotaria magnacalcarata]|nr:unnamed protein product [Rotaria magnacalcarata]